MIESVLGFVGHPAVMVGSGVLTLGCAVWMKLNYRGVSPDLGSLKSVDAWHHFVADPATGLSVGYRRNRTIDQWFPLCYLVCFLGLFAHTELPLFAYLCPVAATLCDYSENHLIAVSTDRARAGRLSAVDVDRVVYASRVKWVMAGFSVCFLLASALGA